MSFFEHYQLRRR